MRRTICGTSYAAHSDDAGRVYHPRVVVHRESHECCRYASRLGAPRDCSDEGGVLSARGQATPFVYASSVLDSLIDLVAGSVLSQTYKCGESSVTKWVVVSQRAKSCRVRTAEEDMLQESDSIHVIACFVGKKGIGQRGRRERVSLYFSTSFLFSCVRNGCQRWYQVHVGGVFN